MSPVLAGQVGELVVTLVITLLIAWYAMILGALLLGLSFRLYKLKASVQERGASMRHASA